MKEFAIPHVVNFPNLSGLDANLTQQLLPRMSFQRHDFPEGQAKQLAIHLVRTLESALLSYERARHRFDDYFTRDSFFSGYLRGISDLELTLMALHRAMRLAEGLVRSSETKLGNSQLPSKDDRDRLRDIRNAIDHVDGPIKKGIIQPVHMLAVLLNETELMIDDEEGNTLSARHTDVGDWVERLHSLALDFINHPER
jgi:hypothetical protein